MVLEAGGPGCEMPASPVPGEEWLPGCILSGLRVGERVCGCPSSSYEDTGPSIVSPPRPPQL